MDAINQHECCPALNVAAFVCPVLSWSAGVEARQAGTFVTCQSSLTVALTVTVRLTADGTPPQPPQSLGLPRSFRVSATAAASALPCVASLSASLSVSVSESDCLVL